MKRYEITATENGVRLCDYLREQGYSRTMLIRLKQEGGLTVNGEFRRNIDPIHTGDIVIIDFPDKAAVLTPNGNVPFFIHYEDDDVVVVEKPDDILMHPATREFDDAIGNGFAFRYPGVPFRPLGRLDRHTTGLCLLAKTKLAAVQQAHGIQKQYLAVAEGIFKENEGTVDEPLLRIPGSTIMRKVDPAGQPSVTHYTVERQYRNHALLRLRLETGRTHQIRVHMAYLGHPLAGDSLYGGKTDIIGRQALHCTELCWQLNGEAHRVFSPLPEDMAALLTALKERNV